MINFDQIILKIYSLKYFIQKYSHSYLEKFGLQFHITKSIVLHILLYIRLKLILPWKQTFRYVFGSEKL